MGWSLACVDQEGSQEVQPSKVPAKASGSVYFCMQGQLLVALCALQCLMMVLVIKVACISSLALSKSLISACLGWKKIPLPYSLTLLARAFTPRAARDPEYTWLLGAVGTWLLTALVIFVAAS